MIVLVVGGISLTLATRIYHINHTVSEENTHIQLIDQIDAAFDDIISELQRTQAAGQFDRLEHVLTLHERLGTQLEAFRSVQKNEMDSPGGERQVAVIADLQSLASQLRAFTDHMLGTPDSGRHLNAGDLDWLGHTSQQARDKTGDLRSTYRLKRGRLLQASDGMMRAILTLYLAFILVSGVLIAVSGIAVNRGIASPLRKLSYAAAGIAEGRLDERVAVRSFDEVGQLSHAFNVMADRLQAHERELRAAHDQLQQKVQETQALYQIGTDILALHELDGVLRSVTDKARELLKSDAAALCLLNPGGDELVVRATSGPSAAFRSGSHPRLCMTVSEALEPSAPPCLFIDPEYLHAHLSARLQRGSTLIGIICVGNRDPREYTSTERELLAGLATQAALAIENARLYEDARSLATLKERERIAREMHDGLAQALGLLHIKLQAALERVASPNPARMAIALQEMMAITDQAYEEVRQSIFGLRTMVSRGLGMIPSLTEYLHEFSAQNGIAVKLELTPGKRFQFRPTTEVQLVRIIQEALTNIRRHAGAAHAWVRLLREDPWVKVIVEDDGRGFDPVILTGTDRRHFGLQTMRERAEGLGGSLEIDTAPGRGTRVVATLPIGV